MIPAEVFPLAEYVCDEMQERGWKTGDVAARMPGDYATNLFCVELLLAVQDDRMKIHDEFFEGLAGALGVSDTMLRNLHATWTQWPDRRAPFEAPESIYTGGDFPPYH